MYLTHFNLERKTRNARTYKKWTRKGNCLSCRVNCGSNHKFNCLLRKEMLESLKNNNK